MKPLRPRKKPTQGRSEATVDAIVEAATRLLETQSLAAFNTNRVAELAGVSIGSLYQYFSNKEALIAVLIERASVRFAADLGAAIDRTRGQGLREGILALVGVAIAQQFERPRLAAALDFMERELPAGRLRMDLRSSIGAQLVEFLADHRSEIDGNLGIVAQDLQTIVRALIDTAALRPDADATAVRARVERAVFGYLSPRRS